jgi:hypothetical protein
VVLARGLLLLLLQQLRRGAAGRERAAAGAGDVGKGPAKAGAELAGLGRRHEESRSRP